MNSDLLTAASKDQAKKIESFNKRLKEVLAKRLALKMKLETILPDFVKEIKETELELSSLISFAKSLKGVSLSESRLDEACRNPFSGSQKFDEGQRRNIFSFSIRDDGQRVR